MTDAGIAGIIRTIIIRIIVSFKIQLDICLQNGNQWYCLIFYIDFKTVKVNVQGIVAEAMKMRYIINYFNV